MLPYGRQTIAEDDIQAVIEVLKSDLITTGPKVDEFEKKIIEFTGGKFAAALSSGTAALHAAMFALDIKPGDEVIVPPITFAASANCVLYQGGTPVFADVEPETLLIDPNAVAEKVTDKTKAIIAVDYAGQPANYDSLRTIADKHGLSLVADACHSLGAQYKGRNVGTLADMTAFSFHPVKPITTAEGGMIVTDNDKLNQKIREFRNHGITTDYKQREESGAWFYAMESLGYNYRLSDLQCALGISQLAKLPVWLERRRAIAKHYDRAFSDIETITPLSNLADTTHAYHLYVIKVPPAERDRIFTTARSKGVGVNVHYIPVHLHPYYQKNLNTGPGLCPKAEEAYQSIISLPVFPMLTNSEQNFVTETIS